MQRLEQVCDFRISTVHSQGVLDEIVGSDAKKICLPRQTLKHENRGGHFDHQTDRDRIVHGYTGADQLLVHPANDGSSLPELLDRGDHGQDDLHFPELGCPKNRFDLSGEEILVPQTQPDSTQSHARVRSFGSICACRLCLFTGLQRPYGHRIGADLLRQHAVGFQLCLHVRQTMRMREEQEFRAKQADPLCPASLGGAHFVRQFRVGKKRDFDAVHGHHRRSGQRCSLLLCGAEFLQTLLHAVQLFRRGVHYDRPFIGVQQQRISRRNRSQKVPNLRDNGEAETPRNDCSMRGSPAGLQCETLDLGKIDQREGRRIEIPRHKDEILGKARPVYLSLSG